MVPFMDKAPRDVVEAAEKWSATHGCGMSGKELELARAWFQLRKNGRQVRRINEVLLSRINAVLRKEHQ
jgi:hypothetical protein